MADSADSNVYNGDSIEVLEGLEPVRRRPGMYTDTTRPNHLGMEVIDNSVDEALAGYADKIEVILHKDQSLEVADNGRGMPVDIHSVEKVPAVELIFGKLHAGGKFSNKNYAFSGGLHGVGVSVVNALSTKLEAEIKRGGKVYAIGYADGVKVEELHEIGEVGRRNTGTRIHFWPNPKYFDSPTFAVKSLVHLLKAKAVLCSGLTITFKDLNTGESDSWCYKGDLGDYISTVLTDTEMLPATPFTGKFEGDGSVVEWAVVWEQTARVSLNESFVNLIPTPQGGTHVNGLRQGLTDAMRDFCRIHNLLPRNVSLIPDDVWDKCCYVLSVKMPEPQFSGQTKEKLSSRDCAMFVANAARDSFSLWLNANIEEAKQIAELCLEAANKRLRSSRTVVRKKATTGPTLPGKLKDCTCGEPMRSELFLVEGDSAGGSANSARDRDYQAVLPLRGKILNTWEKDTDELFESQCIHDIAVAVGLDPDSDDLSGMRYGKVCILADADSDGLHIGTLICALFMKHFKKVVEAGHLYVAMPPLYRVSSKQKTFYALDEEERDKITASLSRKRLNYEVTRFKGLGEMNPEQLKETTMNPATRRLVQLTLNGDNEKHALSIMDMLLSKKRAADRREWLELNGNQADAEL
ncbi:MAG: DNA topoisomerase IV subunit B [Succinivibrionaceae bacterium]|nr:DNA topoisomerase IV subunit B [Succinivibrionaceae bacterium]